MCAHIENMKNQMNRNEKQLVAHIFQVLTTTKYRAQTAGAAISAEFLSFSGDFWAQLLLMLARAFLSQV